MARSQRPASALSCVTSTSVVDELWLRSNISSMIVSPGAAVEVAGRLVGEQHGRLCRESARNRDALLFAAGQLCRVVRPALAETDLLDDAREPPAASVDAGELQRQHDVLERVERRHEVKRLEHEADAVGADLRAAVFVEFDRFLPFSTTWPRVGRSSPASSASSVDLPAPDAPTIATDSPLATVKLTSSRMVRVPSGLLTCFAEFVCRKHRGVIG